jgi:hypothetical protein
MAGRPDPAGKAVLDEASEAMGRDVVAGCHDEDALATTEFVQPALLACDVAAFEVMRHDGAVDPVGWRGIRSESSRPWSPAARCRSATHSSSS